MTMRVPVTSDPKMVWLAQQGLLPSDAAMRMAHLLEAIRREREVKGEGDDKK